MVTPGVDAPAIPRGSDNTAILAQLRKTDGGRQALAMAGVTAIDAGSQPRIAILGGLPSRTLLAEDRATIVGEAVAETGNGLAKETISIAWSGPSRSSLPRRSSSLRLRLRERTGTRQAREATHGKP